MKIPILLALAACAAAIPAQAQPGRDQDIGSFRYMPRIDPITDRDESEATARAAERLGGVPGAVAWTCDGSRLLISITASNAGPGEFVRMIYRFDRDRPDTVDVTTSPTDSAVSVPRELQHAFTARARSANLLVVRLIGRRGGSDRYFDLAGSNRALGMLACVRGLRPAGPPGSGVTRPPRDLPDLPPPGEYEISAVEEPPLLVNRDSVVRAMERAYPREMRRSRTGGEVTLRLRVMSSGAVDPESITVVRSTNAVFDEPARGVAATMRFKPARVNGQPVTVWVTLPVQFSMPGN